MSKVTEQVAIESLRILRLGRSKVPSPQGLSEDALSVSPLSSLSNNRLSSSHTEEEHAWLGASWRTGGPGLCNIQGGEARRETASVTWR